MEFHEKLQELRKQQGLTQEELAKELYVSRTAVSKWESGKGYPNIDSLKEISKFFGVTIDELLSSEELITAAKDENNSNIRHICGLLSGTADLMSLMLILLPLYPHERDGYVSSVTLLNYTHPQAAIPCIYLILFVSLFAVGITRMILDHKKAETGHKTLTGISFLLSIAAVLILIMTRVPYAAVTAFLLLILKSVLLYKTPRL